MRPGGRSPDSVSMDAADTVPAPEPSTWRRWRRPPYLFNADLARTTVNVDTWRQRR